MHNVCWTELWRKQFTKVQKDAETQSFRGISCIVSSGCADIIFGKSLLAIFNNDSKVVAIGYIRLMIIMISHIFTPLYEVMSGYLRGFGISFVPALLTTLGVCGVRIAWIQLVFPHSQTFETIMIGYPIIIAVTTFLILIAVICYHPSRRFYKKQQAKEKSLA